MGVVLLILKILLYIILAVLGIVAVILFLPVNAQVGFVDNKFTFKLRYWLLNIYDSDNKGILAWYLKYRKKKAEKAKNAESPEEDDVFPEELDGLPETDLVPVEEEFPEPEPEIEPESEPVQDTVSSGSEPEPETEFPEDDGDTAEETQPDEEDSGKKKKKRKMTLEEKIYLVLDILEIADRPVLRILKSFKFSEIYIDFIIADADAYNCAVTYGLLSGIIYNALGRLGSICNVKYKTVDINPGFAQKESRWDFAGRFSVRPINMVIAGVGFLITFIFKIFIPGKLRPHLKKIKQRRCPEPEN